MLTFQESYLENLVKITDAFIVFICVSIYLSNYPTDNSALNKIYFDIIFDTTYILKFMAYSNFKY